MSPSNLGSMIWFGCLFAALWLTPPKHLALSHSYKSTRWGRKWRNFETIDSFGSTPSFLGLYSALSDLWKPFTTNFSLVQLGTCQSITLQNVVTSDSVWPGPGLCWAPSSNWLGRVTRLRPGVRSLSGVTRPAEYHRRSRTHRHVRRKSHCSIQDHDLIPCGILKDLQSNETLGVKLTRGGMKQDWAQAEAPWPWPGSGSPRAPAPAPR